MNNKLYYCNKCKYTTEKKFNFNKHCKTKKHTDNYRPLFKEVKPLSREVTPPCREVEKVARTYTCEYCNVTLSNIKNRSRHYNTCRGKKDNEMNKKIKKLESLTTQLKQELDKKDEKIDGIEKDMFDFMKSMVNVNTNTSTTNITNTTNNKINNTNYNMYYIINNYKDAENIEDVLAPPLTREELDYIEQNGSLLGSYNLIKGRCITDKEVSKRPVHCTDSSRKKYLLRYKNEWIIDAKADKLLTMTFNKMKDAYDLECDDITERISNTQQLIKLDIDGRKKLNTQISKDVLLKNNVN